MITATCNNSECDANGIEYNMLGAPSRVECGACRADCELTDPRSDPQMPQPPN